jgi:hypothetical protein
MVSNINPSTSGATTTLGAEQRYLRAKPPTPQAGEAAPRADRVEIGDAAAWSAARESVRQGLAQLGSALAAGRDVIDLLTQVQTIADSAPDDPAAAQSKLDDTLAKLSQRIDEALASGARVLAGENLEIQAEPGAAAVTVAGTSLNFDIPATVDDPEALSTAAARARDAVQGAMERFFEAARALNAHQGFLGALEGAATAGVRSDLDADAARLMALNVRQGLEASGGASIANVEPQAVLSLFRT